MKKLLSARVRYGPKSWIRCRVKCVSPSPRRPGKVFWTPPSKSFPKGAWLGASEVIVL